LVTTVLDLEWNVDAVVPIPLGKSRQAERGYNQVALLGLPLALSLDLPYRPAGLTRIKDTRSQVGLPASERLANVQHAFQAHQDLVQDQTILLLDDVTTTGATLESATQALLQAGAHEVYALTLARTVLSENPLAGSFDLGRPGVGV
jgi:ComF family protein